MFQRMIRVASAAAIVVLGASATADAKPKTTADAKPKPKPQPTNVCASSSKSAQEAEKAGRLRDARELYGKCAAASCGGQEKKCASEAARLDVEIPRVSPVITDEKGAPVVEVNVMIDGEVVATRLDGRPLRVDPGVHDFTFTLPKPQDDIVLTSQRVMIVQGQRGALPFHLHDDSQKAAPEAPAAPAPVQAAAKDEPKDEPPAQAEPKRGGRSVLPWIVGGVGVLGLGSGVLLTYWGNKDNDKLSQCSPNCSASSMTHIKTLYVAADVSFGVGAVGVAVAALLFATRSSEKAPPQTASLRVDVAPSSSGAFTTVSGAF